MESKTFEESENQFNKFFNKHYYQSSKLTAKLVSKTHNFKAKFGFEEKKQFLDIKVKKSFDLIQDLPTQVSLRFDTRNMASIKMNYCFNKIISGLTVQNELLV